jgi:hypothetical protein
MNRRFVMRAAVGMVALMSALVVLESQADARSRKMRRNRDCCCETTCCETTCCQPACCEEAAPVVAEVAPAEAVPVDAAPVDAANCCCACECDPCDCCCKEKRSRRLGHRNRGGGCCDSGCGC